MLRLAYLAMLYKWYGGSISKVHVPEKLEGEISDQDDVASSSTASAADHASETKSGTPGGSSAAPPPAVDSQLQDMSTSGRAADRSSESTPVQIHSDGGRGSGDEELRNKLKRASIVEKLSALTVLTSIVSDLDLFADWYFLNEGLEGESQRISSVALAFTVIGTIMYVLITVEFHLVNKVRTWCRKGTPLNSEQHIPLGWQLIVNVFVEDIPQLVITGITSPTSVAGALNIATAGFSLLAKGAEGYQTRHDVPMSSQLIMVDEYPGVVEHLMVQQRNAQELATKAARLAVLVDKNGREKGSMRGRSLAFQVMQATPDLLSGKLNYIRDQLDIPKLELRSSTLKGTIPPALGTLKLLQHLDLSNNDLTGTIPPALGTLTVLQHLDLSNNDLTGPIPRALGGLTSLETLSLNFNNLTGTIPPELGGLTALRWLNLQSNKLTGPVPSQLGGLTALQALMLRNNNLDGRIPASLGHLHALGYASFARNEFNETSEEVKRLLADTCGVEW